MKPEPLTATLLLALMMAVAPIHAGTILFVSDTTTDLDIATVLAGDGHAVTTVTNDYATGNATLKGDLSGYDAVFWSTSQVNHTDAALLTALSTWVIGGGKLFVTGADGVINSYNPTTAFQEFLGGAGGWDGGYNLTPIANLQTSLTVGVVDVRGLTPSYVGDTDSLCGPLATGTIGLTTPTTGSSPCADGAYGWTLRQLGLGEIAWVQSGNFTSTVPPDEPLWTDTSPTGFGMYNGAVRNFAANASRAAGTAIPTANGWGLATMIFLVMLTGLGLLRRNL
jgi:hypothetical protein